MSPFKEYVIQIQFQDRLGLGYEVFKVCEKNHVDKVGMEVSPENGMMIRFRCKDLTQAQTLIANLKMIRGVINVEFKKHMPYEERVHELNTILNSVSEGVVAVNKDGKITHFNQVAAQIFDCKINEVIGLHAEELFSKDPPILETIKDGQPYSLKERKIRRGNKLIHILSSGVPIIDNTGEIIGAVITIKDYRQVEELISKVDKKRSMTTFDNIIHQSEKMRRLIETAKIVAKNNSTILLRGESGTGKELFAKAIHMESPRSKGPFIALNCAALPDSLLESELFGYEEGAFTGAAKGGKKGLFEQANNGTIFLDEIGEVSLPVQVRLLRVIQEATVRRVGSSQEIPVDVRIIAATHRNLEDMIKAGEFREDLYYRLNVIPLIIPPLRERSEDIPLIAQHLTRKISAKLGKPQLQLTKESINLLSTQPWPGNVRQLENSLERVINIIDTAEIRPQYFYDWTDLVSSPSTPTSQIETGEKSFQIKVPINGEWPTLKEIVFEVEKQVLTRVLETHTSSRKAGKILGVSNTTVLNKMKTYGISPD